MTNVLVPVTHDEFNVDVLKPGMFVKFSIAFEIISAGGFVKKIIRVENYGLLTEVTPTEIRIVMSPKTAECITTGYIFEESDLKDYLTEFTDTREHIGNEFYYVTITRDMAKNKSLQLSFLDESDTLIDRKPVYYWR